MGAQVPWTTWGRFAHNSPRVRVEVHLPRVLESRSAGQRALAPPTDGHPPDYRTIQTLHNHFPCHPPTAFQPRYGRNQPPLNQTTNTNLNHPSCRIQERFRHNHPSFVILQLRLNHNHNHNKTGGAANVPRMERARRPPEAENRAHIPRAIASREAMLWQGCNLSPRELERKAPRSVWATQLPASRPIRWIVRESREANRTDSPAFHRTDFATHPARPRTDSPAFYRTNFARAPARQSDGLTFGIPSPAFPRTDFARIRKADADSTIS